MAKTAMGSALEKAGIRSAQQRLDEIAERAFSAHPKTGDAARDMLLREVFTDLELTIAMFANWHRPAAQLLLNAAAARIREKRAAEAPQSSGAKLAMDTSVQSPQGKLSGRRAAEPTPEQRADARGYVAAVISKLDTFKINGRPIGDCTPEEALAWRDSRSRDNRFVDMLVQGCPPNLPIRRFVKPDEAEVMYKIAQREDGRNE